MATGGLQQVTRAVYQVSCGVSQGFDQELHSENRRLLRATWRPLPSPDRKIANSGKCQGYTKETFGDKLQEKSSETLQQQMNTGETQKSKNNIESIIFLNAFSVWRRQTQVDQQSVRRIFGKLWEISKEIRKHSRHFQNIPESFRTFQGHFLERCRTFPGHFHENQGKPRKVNENQEPQNKNN